MVEVLENLWKEGILSKEELDKINNRIMTNNSTKIYVSTLLESFKKWLVKKYTPNTVASYLLDSKSFLEFILQVDSLKTVKSNVVLPNIQGKDVQLWINKLSMQGYEANSLRRYKNSLINLFNFIADEYKVCMLDVNTIDTPKEIHNADIDAIRHEEILQIANYSNSVRDKAIILMLYDVGMRRQELINCKKGDINFSNNTVNIYVNGRLDRVGRFSDETKKVLLEHIDRWEDEVIQTNIKRKASSLKRNEKYVPLEMSPYLFQTARSPMMSYATVLKAIKDSAMEYYLNKYNPKTEDAKSLCKAKAEAINTETLRHSKRAYLFSLGKSVDQVQAIMGDENTWVCKRYIKVAQQLYPEKF